MYVIHNEESGMEKQRSRDQSLGGGIDCAANESNRALNIGFLVDLMRCSPLQNYGQHEFRNNYRCSLVRDHRPGTIVEVLKIHNLGVDEIGGY